MKLRIFLLLIGLVLVMSGCADAAQVEFTNPNEHVYGFWGGVWHGMIMFPSFIGSLFDSSIAVYAVSNNGAWYNFGFVGGFGLILRFIGGVLRAIRG